MLILTRLIFEDTPFPLPQRVVRTERVYGDVDSKDRLRDNFSNQQSVHIHTQQQQQQQQQQSLVVLTLLLNNKLRQCKY